jgi:hypothetical protein
MTAEPGPVDRYLDDLFDRLAGTGAAGRRTLAEAEDHLRAAADQGEALGLSRSDAERRAVAAFGAADRVAAQLRAVHRPDAWLRPAFAGAWLAGALGLLGIGASGLVAEVFGRIFGPEFVAGDGPGVTYTAARCAEYLRLFPGAGGCTGAAAMDHWGEVVQFRVLAGVLGLLALAVFGLARRRTAFGEATWQPPRGAVAVPLGALFAVTGAGFTGLSLMQLAYGGRDMLGANLSAGIVALAAAALCFLRYGRSRRHPVGRAA